MTVSPDTVFAVSGGGRGITARCVICMAQQYGCRFLLVGRTVLEPVEPAWAGGAIDRSELQKRYFEFAAGKPHPREARQAIDNVIASREIQGTLQHIQAAGGRAAYAAADITKLPDLQTALEVGQQQIGPVTGILHGAGNLADALIENKTPQDFDYVYGAKVEGLKNLLDCLPVERLRYLILFASAAGFYGNAGQSDYAIANEILNKAASMIARTQPHCRVHVFNWGPWDGGMVTPQLREHFVARNIDVLPIVTGTQALIDELDQPWRGPQVAVGKMPPVSHPEVDSRLRSYRVRRQLTLADNPFLEHHRIHGHPVLPMVHALHWIASVCEDLHPVYHFFRCENYQVLKGIVFDESLAPEYLLQISETQKSGEQIVLDCLIQSQSTGPLPRYHYRAQIVLVRRVPEMPQYRDFDLTDSAGIDGASLYTDGTLFHGPYLQGVRRVLNIGATRLTMECTLPKIPHEAQGQFAAQAFNPFLADIQMQALVIWARKMRDSASLPLHCGETLYYCQGATGRSYLVSLEVRQATESRVTGDLILHDQNGRVYASIVNGQVALSRQLQF